MAHFARLESKIDPTGFTTDTHLVVVRVHVVGNDNPANGGTIGENDMHVDGEKFCEKFYKGGIWKQTSYNNNFRKQYAAAGFVYDPVKDKFLHAQPYASWSLDDNDDWQAPVEFPTNITYTIGEVEHIYDVAWNEEGLKWTAENHNGQPLDWDPSALEWVAV
tara:strand:+ start:3792 stop:4277 length:486 start_codon:yes stop_codon:yes gene_type:complete